MAALARFFVAILVPLALLVWLGSFIWGIQSLSQASRANSDAVMTQAQQESEAALSEARDSIGYPLGRTPTEKALTDTLLERARLATDRYGKLVDNPPKPFNTARDYGLAVGIWASGFLSAAIIFALAMALSLMAHRMASLKASPVPAPTASAAESASAFPTDQAQRDTGSPT